MSTLSAVKIAEAMLESAVETYEAQDQMLDLTMFEEHDPATMQNAGNVVWRPVQQHAPVIDGFDLTGLETEIIEENYPAVLGTPKNDFVKQRADDMRDMRYWQRRAEQSGRQQATEQNTLLANAVKNQGSMFIRSAAANGYEFVGEAQALMNERQAVNNGRNFVLNDRDMLKFATDLSNRETVKGRPETAWAKGQIGSQVAEFDIFAGSYLPNLVGGADPASTVTGNQSFKPEGGTVNATTLVVTNVDYREADIVVNTSVGYNVGDKIQFDNAGTVVESVGLADKNGTGQNMTFTIVDIPDGTTITIFPKPIAADDPALTAVELASANINTRILNGALVERLNIDASNKTNLFWDKGAIEVIGGTIPAELFAEFDGNKVLQSTLKNGVNMYMLYDGNIASLNFRFRIFTWYGITVCNPSNCGVAVTI